MIFKFYLLALVLMFVPIAASAQIAAGGGFSIEKSVVSGGGATSSNGAFTVAGTIGQNAAGTNATDKSLFQIGGFWTPEQFVPTAAGVSISGKISFAGGRGIRNVIVRLTDVSGAARTTVTGLFGAYRFTDVEVGQTYVLTIESRKYVLANPSLIISVNEELTGLDFTAIK